LKIERLSYTIFEGAATSDPVPVEPYTGALAETIRFFASQEHGKFRFVTNCYLNTQSGKNFWAMG